MVHELGNRIIPEGFQERVEHAVRNQVENSRALKQMEELREVVERIDFKWEKGFMTPEEYIAKRSQLQKEMDALRPVDYDELIEAADLLQHFPIYWENCGNEDNPEEARRQLVAKIVDRVFVYDNKVVAIALHGSFGVVLDDTTTMPNGGT